MRDDSMTAVRLHGRGDLRIEQVPIPMPAAREVLLRVEVAAVCGSDVGEFRHGPALAPVTARHRVTGHLGPLTLGHEFSGTVVKTGEGVDGLEVGQLVASGSSMWCGECRQCRAGNTNRCPDYWAVGLQCDGGLADYVAVPAQVCFPIAEAGLSPEAGALVQPMAIAMHSVKRATLPSAGRVAVIGAGGVGAFVIAALRALQHVDAILAVELDPERRRTAAALGATTVVADVGESAGEVDVVFETSGHPDGLAAALALAAPGGQIVLTGIQPPGSGSADVLRQVTLRELTLSGPMACVVRSDVPDAIRVLAARGDWSDVAPLVHPLQSLPGLFGGEGIEGASALKALFAPGLSEARPASY